jgi:hypothetical protein
LILWQWYRCPAPHPHSIIRPPCHHWRPVRLATPHHPHLATTPPRSTLKPPCSHLPRSSPALPWGNISLIGCCLARHPLKGRCCPFIASPRPAPLPSSKWCTARGSHRPVAPALPLTLPIVRAKPLLALVRVPMMVLGAPLLVTCLCQSNGGGGGGHGTRPPSCREPPPTPGSIRAPSPFEGWQLVTHRGQWQRLPHSPPPSAPPHPPRRAVPVDLIGLCFNCLQPDRMTAVCTNPHGVYAATGRGTTHGFASDRVHRMRAACCLGSPSPGRRAEPDEWRCGSCRVGPGGSAQLVTA